MPVVIRDLVPAFLEFWDRAAGASTERQLELWDEYATGNPEVANEITRTGGVPDPRQALERYPELEARICTNASLAAQWIAEANKLVPTALQAKDIAVPCITMVGLATSNGWVSEVDGRPTLFLAVEQIPDARAGRILAAHEIAHALQLPLPNEPWQSTAPSGTPSTQKDSPLR